MDKSELSQQAKNSLDLYRGGDPNQIRRLLNMQGKSVVDELMKYFNAKNINELSIKASIGK